MSALKPPLWVRPWHGLKAMASAEGSTRLAALLRIAFVLLVWARWGRELMPLRHIGEPEWWVVAAIFYPATLLCFVGLFTRITAPLAGLSTLLIYYWLGFGLDHEPYTHHHTYILMVGMVLVGLSPCGRSYSIDRWWAVRRAAAKGQAPPPERGPTWAIQLIAVQVSCMYLWTAYDKTHIGFLSGQRLDMVYMYYYLGSDRPDHWLYEASLWLQGSGTVLIEYLLPFTLWFKRTRAVSILVGIVFHGLLYAALPVLTFTATMYAAYLAFCDPDQVHAWLEGKAASPA